MIRKTVITIFVLFVYANFLCAEAPKYSNEFLSIGVGARAFAMGNAYIASVNDVTAGFWNPSGLLHIKSNLQVSGMHSEYFAGIAKYDYAAISSRIDNSSAFGFSLIRFGVDDIPNTLDLIDPDGNINYDNISSFSAADYGFLFSYARKSNIEGLSLGGNTKIIHRKVGDFGSAWGFGLDVGAQYAKGKWRYALMGKDITSTFNAWSFNTEELEEVFLATGNEIPQNSLEITLPKLIAGAAYETNITGKITGLAELNIDMTFDGKRNVLLATDPLSIDPHLGFEVGYNNFIFLRGGINNIQNVTDVDGKTIKILQPNLGIGIKIKSLSIDYAITNLGTQTGLLYSNVFSLKLDIYKYTPASLDIEDVK